MNTKKFKEVKVAELETILEPTIYQKLKGEKYQIFQAEAIDFLSYNRFDVAFKIHFLEILPKNPIYGREFYLEHIKAFSFGSFKEPNNEEKVNKDKFVEIFIELFKDISMNGFEINKSLIPVSLNNVILNGSHRLSSAIFCGKDIFYIKTENKETSFDYKFFYERNVPTTYLDNAATTFAKWGSNVFIALVWPSAKGNESQVENKLKKVVYRKDIKLNLNGAHNLMSQVYSGENWLGEIENNYKGTIGKVVECFKDNGPLRVYLFQAQSLEEVLKIKDEIRDIYKIDKHSIHITDTQNEVEKLSKILFNDNSVHFLNNAKPNEFLSFHKKLNKFKDFVLENKIDLDDIILDSGMILSLYGIRKSQDIDYIINKNYPEISQVNGISSHNLEIKFHDKKIENLLYNPENYFFFNDVKFISFNQLYIFKKNRKGQKDLIDLDIMDALLTKNSKEMALGKLRQKLFYIKHKLRYMPIILTIKFLKLLGAYDLVRKKYHEYKSRD